MTTRDEILADIRFHGERLTLEEVARLVRSRVNCSPKAEEDAAVRRLADRCSRYLYRRVFGIKALVRGTED